MIRLCRPQHIIRDTPPSPLCGRQESWIRYKFYLHVLSGAVQRMYETSSNLFVLLCFDKICEHALGINFVSSLILTKTIFFIFNWVWEKPKHTEDWSCIKVWGRFTPSPLSGVGTCMVFRQGNLRRPRSTSYAIDSTHLVCLHLFLATSKTGLMKLTGHITHLYDPVLTSTFIVTK